MTTTQKQLDKLAFKKSQMVFRRTVIKGRLLKAKQMAHLETCPKCRKAFDSYMQAQDFAAAAGKETENLMNSLLSKSLH